MKVLFVSSGNSKIGISPIILSQGESLEKYNAEIELDYYLIEGKGITGYIKSIPKLRKKLRNNQFNIIHAHYSLSAIVASLAGANPLVVSLMGSDIKARRWYKWMIYFFHRFFWKETIVKSDDMKHSLGFNGVKVIPNGVDSEVFYPMEKMECQAKLGWDLKKKHILFPSNPKRPEKNYKLLSESIAFAQNSNIELHTLVDIPHYEIPSILNATDVIVLTSLWEGSPNAIKEAMACNRPIVATEVGDINWLFDTLDGCYITSFYKETLASVIQKALLFSDKYKNTKGRERIINLNLTSKNVAAELCNVYKSIGTK